MRRAAALCVALLCAASFPASAADKAPVQESAPGSFKSRFGYATVQEALQSLKAKANATVEVSKPDGWTIVTEPAPEHAVWSFTPPGHYAYPAVVRRAVKQRPDGDLYVEMAALCQAEKEPCERLIREFQQLNDRMAEDVRKRIEQGQAGR